MFPEPVQPLLKPRLESSSLEVILTAERASADLIQKFDYEYRDEIGGKNLTMNGSLIVHTGPKPGHTVLLETLSEGLTVSIWKERESATDYVASCNPNGTQCIAVVADRQEVEFLVTGAQANQLSIASVENCTTATITRSDTAALVHFVVTESARCNVEVIGSEARKGIEVSAAGGGAVSIEVNGVPVSTPGQRATTSVQSSDSVFATAHPRPGAEVFLGWTCTVGSHSPTMHPEDRISLSPVTEAAACTATFEPANADNTLVVEVVGNQGLVQSGAGQTCESSSADPVRCTWQVGEFETHVNLMALPPANFEARFMGPDCQSTGVNTGTANIPASGSGTCRVEFVELPSQTFTMVVTDIDGNAITGPLDRSDFEASHPDATLLFSLVETTGWAGPTSSCRVMGRAAGETTFSTNLRSSPCDTLMEQPLDWPTYNALQVALDVKIFVETESGMIGSTNVLETVP